MKFFAVLLICLIAAVAGQEPVKPEPGDGHSSGEVVQPPVKPESGAGHPPAAGDAPAQEAQEVSVVERIMAEVEEVLESLKGATSGNVDNLNKQLKEVSAKLEAALGQLQSATSETVKQLEKRLRGMKDVVDSTIKKLAEAGSKGLGSTVEKVRNTVEGLLDSVRNTRDSLAENLLNLAKRIKENTIDRIWDLINRRAKKGLF